MKHQAKGALIAFAFVAAFIASIALHSLVASVIVLLTGVTVAYVTGIAWMRTSGGPNRVRGKQRSVPELDLETSVARRSETTTKVAGGAEIRTNPMV